MKVFLDSNIFLYSFLNQDVAKKSTAAKIVADAIRDRSGYISLQVVKEFCNVMIKKSKKPVAEVSVATKIFEKLNLVKGSIDLVRRALEIKERYQIQFYDSLLVAAAETAKCEKIYSEDLNDGQLYCGIKAVNPFKLAGAAGPAR